MTPFLKAHSTAIAGVHKIPSGDDRYYNNVFVAQGDLSPYDKAILPVTMSGNVFLTGAKPAKLESAALVKPEADPALLLLEKVDGFHLEMNIDKSWSAAGTRLLVTTERLGKAAIPDFPYELSDGTPLRINTDYFTKNRNEANPTPGPFGNPGTGTQTLKMW